MTSNVYNIPFEMMAAINRYLENGVQPGGFLASIICNDLRGAVSRADPRNAQLLKEYLGYFNMEVPSICWGSAETMFHWMYEKRVKVALEVAAALRLQGEGEDAYFQELADKLEGKS